MSPRRAAAGMALAAWLVLLAAPGARAAAVTIEEAAVQPRVAGPGIARVVVRVTNPGPERRALDLRLTVWWEYVRPRRADRFATGLTLAPGETRRLALPVLAAPDETLDVTVHDPAGAVLAQARRRVARRSPAELVILVCEDERVCQALQSRIAFAGDDEDRVTKRKVLGFEVLRDPPAEWWSYGGTVAVVLAVPGARLDALRREALELYARQGGRLVLVEDLVGDPAFLAPYRGGGRRAAGQVIGAGRLVAVPHLDADGLAAAFRGAALAAALRPPHEGGRGTTHAFQPADELMWVRERLVPALAFPGAGWLIAWLTAYIVVVGPLSFGVLRWWGRPEWGWVTIPAVALAFAGLLYAVGSAGRPRQFALDEVAVYWMDDASPVAAADLAVRVSGPRRSTTTVVLRGDGVLAGAGRRHPQVLPGFGPGDGVPSWDVRLDAPMRLALPLRQWSFADLELRGARRLPGTVARLADGRLRNDTGQRFAATLYVERDTLRRLGPLPPGAVVDPTAVAGSPLAGHLGVCGPAVGTLSGAPCEAVGRREDERREPAPPPFDLLELVRGWPRHGGDVFDSRSALLLGLAEGPEAGAELPGVDARVRRHVVTIVSFRAAP